MLCSRAGVGLADRFGGHAFLILLLCVVSFSCCHYIYKPVRDYKDITDTLAFNDFLDSVTG